METMATVVRIRKWTSVGFDFIDVRWKIVPRMFHEGTVKNKNKWADGESRSQWSSVGLISTLYTCFIYASYGTYGI